MRILRYSLRRVSPLDTVNGGTHNPKVGGSNPPPATNAIIVRSGDIGNRTFRRHGSHAQQGATNIKSAPEEFCGVAPNWAARAFDSFRELHMTCDGIVRSMV